MHPNEFQTLLDRTLADGHVSRNEGRQLKAWAVELTEDERNACRAKIFARARREGESQPAGVILDWVEATLKCLRPRVEASQTANAYFSPGEDCRNALHARISGARRSLDVCVFTITDNKISGALQAAHDRGVKLRIITDNHKAEDRGSDIDALDRSGVNIREDMTSAHMHHKYAIVDGTWLINGSYNWTVSAWRENEENIVVSNDRGLVRQFQTQFDSLWSRLG